MVGAIRHAMTTACSESPDRAASTMPSKVARTILMIIGGLAVLVGGVWIGQGAGLIKGSFMTGSRTWLAIGLLCLVVGLLLIFLTRRPRSGGGQNNRR
jgi:hypothetical protein